LSANKSRQEAVIDHLPPLHQAVFCRALFCNLGGKPPHMNPQVTDYIAAAPAGQQALLETLRRIVHDSVPGVVEEFKWSRPVFRTARQFAYLKTAAAYVTLGFYDASHLDDPDGRLEGSGQQMRHIKLRTSADIDAAQLAEWLRTASA
jgi:hypothetical protein